MEEDKRNTILAVVLSMIVLIGWQYMFPANPPITLIQNNQSKTTNSHETTPFNNNSVNISPVSRSFIDENQNFMFKNNTDESDLHANTRIIINDPAISGSLTLLGAKLDNVNLRQYREDINLNSAPITLFRTGNQIRESNNTLYKDNLSYFATYGWIGSGTTLPDSNTVWQADNTTLSREKPITLKWENPEGVIFQQTWQIEDRFLLRVEQSVINHSNTNIVISNYGLISRGGKPLTSGFFILHEGPIGVLNSTLEEMNYEDLTEAQQIRYQSTSGWIGLSDKYWLAALIPNKDSLFNATFSGKNNNDIPRYQIDFMMGEQYIAPGEKLQQASHLFIGAKETLLLDRYRDTRNFHRFDLAIDFGILYFITKPIFYALHWLFEILDNFGLAIIALTIGIKMIFFPLSNKSYVSISKMKLLQPKMLELKERYGDDRIKLNNEMMELYKKEQVNPLSGCLPILLQMPVFFSLYKVLLVTIEMRHAPFFGWIHDLSAPDPLGILTLFGLINWNVPEIFSIFNLGIWPIIMGLTMYLQQKLNPSPADPIQAKIFAWMPIFFTFLLATFPAGLVIYWACNNTLTIAQQWIIIQRLNRINVKK